MRTLSDFRARYGETFGLKASYWRNFQADLSPILGMSIVGARVVIDTSPGFQTSPAASPEDCGLLIIAAMLRGERPIDKRVLLRWHAQAVGGKCAVTGVTFLHEAMVTLLRLPDVAERLDRLELTREFAAVMLAWKDGRQTMFESRDVQDQARRAEIMSKGRLLTVAMLGGAVFRDIGTWLAADDPTTAPEKIGELVHQ